MKRLLGRFLAFNDRHVTGTTVNIVFGWNCFRVWTYACDLLNVHQSDRPQTSCMIFVVSSKVVVKTGDIISR